MKLQFLNDGRITFDHSLIGSIKRLPSGKYLVTDIRDNYSSSYHYACEGEALGHFYLFTSWKQYTNTAPKPISRTIYKRINCKIWATN